MVTLDVSSTGEVLREHGGRLLEKWLPPSRAYGRPSNTSTVFVLSSS